jgi:4-hydroxy-tetrahydrodipicolinate synthase
MMQFRGCGTALVTPFRQDGTLDEATMRKLVQRQIAAGIDFLVPCGTTGESPTLTHEEHLKVIEITVLEAAGKTPVMAGAGGYNTSEVVALAREIKAIGADGLLSVTPYYNKPNPEGLYQHYKAIAAATPLPIIVYNISSRTGINVEPATLKKLAEIETIVGVKEASGNISQMASVMNVMPEGFAVLSGDDAITIPLIALGGHGVISVASNEIPAEMTKLTQLALAGDYAGAREVQRRWFDLMSINFIEPNPIPAKYAMSLMGLLEPAWRLPMVPPSDATKTKIEAMLKANGLLAASSTGVGQGTNAE